MRVRPIDYGALATRELHHFPAEAAPAGIVAHVLMYRYNIYYMKSPVKRSNVSSKEAVDDRMRKLKGLILETRDGHALDSLLYDLLTPHERAVIGERVAILQALAHGETLREVAKKVRVSIGKVERGSTVFQYGKVDWKKVLTSPPR